MVALQGGGELIKAAICTKLFDRNLSQGWGWSSVVSVRFSNYEKTFLSGPRQVIGDPPSLA